jgi:hypothetical protein
VKKWEPCLNTAAVKIPRIAYNKRTVNIGRQPEENHIACLKQKTLLCGRLLGIRIYQAGKGGIWCSLLKQRTGGSIVMDSNVMNKFEFLLGNWTLEYRIPKSIFSEEGSDTGTGSFKKALNDKYVFFEYSTRSGSGATGIFAWDDKIKAYRYWWFENSGNFLTATCYFISDEILAMNWHDSLLVQTFVKEGPCKVILKMEYPAAKGGHEPVLEVMFTRKNN